MAKSKQVGVKVTSRLTPAERAARKAVVEAAKAAKVEAITAKTIAAEMNPLKTLEAQLKDHVRPAPKAEAHTAGDGSVTVRPHRPEPVKRGRPRTSAAPVAVSPVRTKQTVSDERAAAILVEYQAEMRTPIAEAEFLAAALKETGWSCAEFARRVSDGTRKDMGKWWDHVIYRTTMLALAPKHQELIDEGTLSDIEGWHLGRIPAEHREQFIARLAEDKQSEKPAFSTAKALRAFADTLIPQAA